MFVVCATVSFPCSGWRYHRDLIGSVGGGVVGPVPHSALLTYSVGVSLTLTEGRLNSSGRDKAHCWCW